MQELFTLSNVCASQVSAHDMKYMACGKVNIVCNGKNMTGYIMEEMNEQ